MIAALFAVVAIAHAGAPLIVRLVQPTRRPTAAERDRLDRLCQTAGLDVRSVVVLETTDAKTAVALVRGLPGLRSLLVSDYLLEEVDDETLAASLAAQAGRARLGHLELRVGAVAGGGVVPVALLLGDLTVPLVADGLVALGVAALAVAALWFGRRLVYRADEYAADRTSPDAVIAALERHADLNDAPTDWGLRRSLTAMEPPIDDRIARFRADDGRS